MFPQDPNQPNGTDRSEYLRTGSTPVSYGDNGVESWEQQMERAARARANAEAEAYEHAAMTSYGLSDDQVQYLLLEALYARPAYDFPPED